MTVLHSGTTKKYSSNWDQVFGKPRPVRREKVGGLVRSADKKPSAKKAVKKASKAKKS